MARTIEYRVQEAQDEMKIYDYLRRSCGLSYRLITTLKHDPLGICQNGVHARTIDRVHTGDCISVTMPHQEQENTPSAKMVPIAYEDEDTLVYEKPAGMNCHQSRRIQNDTLANVFAAHCQKENCALIFRCLNRLDKDTSGLVLLAKNQYAAARLKNAAQKEYLALVCGVVAEEEGTVNAPIARINEIYTKRQVDEEGQEARTFYRVVARGEKYTLLRLRLETGRTHQIRVHMAHIGHPLAGDDLYGGDVSLIARQALHCCAMSFVSPVSEKSVVLRSSLPQDIKKAVQEAGIYSDNA